MIGIVGINETIDHVEFFVNTVTELEQLTGGVYNGHIIGHGSCAFVKENRQIYLYDAQDDEWFAFTE